MSSTLLQPPILWQPDDYLLFQKCGEITVSPDILNIGYNCSFCTGVCLQSDIFLQHLQEQHKEDVYKLYEKQNSKLIGSNLNEILVNLSDLNFKNTENTNTIIALDYYNNEEVENEKDNDCKSFNCLEPKEMLTFANDLNLFNDLNANDLLTLNTTTPNQEIENLVTQNPMENLTNTNVTTTTTTLTNSCMSNYLKCLTADSECEIGDGEDSGIMLAQSPCTSSSECGGFSDCMSFTEDNSSNKSTPTHNESWKSTSPNLTDKSTTTEIFDKKQVTPLCPKSKYINTPAMRKALNNHALVSYLLEAFRKNEKLWNPQHPSYKYNAHRTMYNELSQPLLNDMKYSLTGVEIFGILNLLRGRYRRELTKFETRKGKHKTRLWYFEKMSFLRNIIEEKRKERKRDKELESKSGQVDGQKNLSNREYLSFLLKLYRRNECLWNPKDIEYNMDNKSKVYDEIANQFQKKFNIKWPHTECMNEIQKLLLRYRKELRIYYKLKGLYIPKLWCFDEMDFLRPIVEEKITKNLKKNFNYTALNLSQRKHDFLKASEIKFNNFDQQLQFIEIYRNYTSLWDVNHPDYRSANFRKKSLNEMLVEVKLAFNVKCYELQQLEKTLYKLRKDYSAEKLKRLTNISGNFTNQLQSTNKGLSTVLYEKLNQFLVMHLGPFRCDSCQLICKTYDQYKIHSSKHDGSLPFICALCGKGFQMSGNLTIHIRRHRQDFPYACEICKKSFATSTEVSIHMRSHTGERPYECELCNKTFKTWSFYDLHKRTHFKQSNFHCPICDKSFYERNRFTDHMNVHLNIRKHQCEKCNKSFTTIGNLKKHLELHASIKKYKCQPCGKCFKQYASLRWHRKTQHEE